MATDSIIKQALAVLAGLFAAGLAYALVNFAIASFGSDDPALASSYAFLRWGSTAMLGLVGYGWALTSVKVV